MTTYSIWPATNGPDTSNSDGQAINLGIEFYVTDPAWVTHLRFYRGSALVQPDNLRLYEVDSAAAGTMVAEVTAPTFSGTGWQEYEIDPVELTPDQRYRVVAHMPDDYTATGGYWASGGPGDGGRTNGILVAPDDDAATGNDQGSFLYSPTPAFPTESFNGGNYWVDIIATDEDPDGGVTGTGSAVLGALTATASGVPTTFGAAAVVLGALAATVSGVRTVQGVAVASLGGLGATASGGRTVVAAAAAVLGGLSGTASGTRTTFATANAMLGVMAATIVGQVSLRGTGSAVLGALTATATVAAPQVAVATGSWDTLRAITREARQLAEAERARTPVACPNDGEPLQKARGVLHCSYDGWMPT